MSKHFLNVLTLALDLNPLIAGVNTDYVVFDEMSQGNAHVISAKEQPIACGIMFRREPMFQTGLYDPDFLLHEGKDFRGRFEANFPIGHVPIPLYRYLIIDTNIA